MRKLTLAVLLLLSGLLSFAGDITQPQALKIAQLFLRSNVTAMKSQQKGGSDALKLVYTADDTKGRSCVYVFNAGQNGGFILVSAEDRAAEVLGYSDTGSFDYSRMSPEMRNWMEGYVDEITYIRDNDVEAAPQSYANSGKKVAPLLGNIMWDQSAPYNNMCPDYDLSTRCATGCVATAMAQVMYYHRWPEVGKGSYTYAPSILGGGTLTADFGSTHYDWDDMLPVYDSNSSDASCDAVAELMLHCGISVSMSYSSSSGAESDVIPYALYHYFDYDKGVAYRQRDNYSSEEWQQIIDNEIDNGRPVIATGRSSAGGHAFVFDGYDENGFVHVNWGWSGMSNGYFRTSALNPPLQGTGGSEGGYNYDQQIITGIQPPKTDTYEDVELVSSEGLVSADKTIANGGSTDISLRGMIYNTGWQKSKFEYGMLLVDAQGNTVEVYRTDNVYELEVGYGFYGPLTVNVKFGKLNDGDYKLYPVCRQYGSDGAWNRIRDSYVGYPNYLNINVSGDVMTFSYPDYFDLNIDEMDVPVEIYSGVPACTKATVVNGGDVNYLGEVMVTIYDKNTLRPVTSGSKYKIDLAPGASVDVDLFDTYSLTAGDYLLAVTDDDNRIISSMKEISVKSAPSETAVITPAAQLSFADNSNVDAQSMNITASLKCNQGVFGGYVYLYIFNESGAVIRGCLEPQYLMLKSGETADVTFSGAFENGVAGTRYLAALLLYNGTTYSYIDPIQYSTCFFTLAPETTGIDNVNADEMGKKVMIYDLNGRLRPETSTDLLPKGMYIVKQGDNTRKIVK